MADMLRAADAKRTSTAAWSTKIDVANINQPAATRLADYIVELANEGVRREASEGATQCDLDIFQVRLFTRAFPALVSSHSDTEITFGQQKGLAGAPKALINTQALSLNFEDCVKMLPKGWSEAEVRNSIYAAIGQVKSRLETLGFRVDVDLNTAAPAQKLLTRDEYAAYRHYRRDEILPVTRLTLGWQ